MILPLNKRKPIIDLTGQKFGNLMALEIVRDNNLRIKGWRCICDCGKEVIYPTTYLKRELRKRCTDCIKKSMNGDKICSKCNTQKSVTYFGKDKQQKDGYKCWCKKCRTLDGQRRFREKWNFNKEFRDKSAKLAILRRNTSPDNYIISLFLSCKYRATKKLKCQFDLTKEYLLSLNKEQNNKCFYTGIDMTFIAGKGKLDTNVSIDRINPKLGYIKGNIVLCCYFVNVSKREKSLEEWLSWTNLVIQYNYLKNIKTA